MEVEAGTSVARQAHKGCFILIQTASAASTVAASVCAQR